MKKLGVVPLGASASSNTLLAAAAASSQDPNSTTTTTSSNTTFTFYTNVRRINQDTVPPVCISWQSFVAESIGGGKSDFSLSALPRALKDHMFRKYEIMSRLHKEESSSSAAEMANSANAAATEAGDTGGGAHLDSTCITTTTTTR
jgi:hypothetical protein